MYPKIIRHNTPKNTMAININIKIKIYENEQHKHYQQLRFKINQSMMQIEQKIEIFFYQKVKKGDEIKGSYRFKE